MSACRVRLGALLICQALGSTALIAAATVAVLAGTRISPTPSLGTLGVAAMAIGTMAFVPIAGRVSSRGGRRTALAGGALVAAVAASLIVASLDAASFTLFNIACLLLGAGYATLLSYRFAAAEIVEAEARPRVHSAFLATGLVASVAGPLLAERSAAFGDMPLYAGSFVVASVGWAGCALLLWLTLSPSTAPERTQSRAGTSAGTSASASASTIRSTQRSGATPVVLLALAGSIVATGCMTAMMQGMPLAMTANDHHLHGVSVVMQAHFLGMYVPGLFAAAIIARVGVQHTILAGAVIGILGAAAALSGSGLHPFMIALTACGLAWGLIIVASGAAISAHADIDSETRYNFAISCSAAIVALVVGFAMQSIGWHGINTLALVSFAALALGAPWLMRRRQL